MLALRCRTGVRLILASSVIVLMFGCLAVLTLRSFQRLDEATNRVQTLQGPLEAGLEMLSAAYKLFEAQTTLVMTEDFEQIDRFNETLGEIEKCQSAVEPHLRTEEERAWLRALKTSFGEFDDQFHGRLLPAAMKADYDEVQKAHGASKLLLETIEGQIRHLSGNFQDMVVKASRTALETTEDVRTQTARFMIAAVVVAVLTSWLLGLSIIRPIQQLIEGTRRVSEGDLDNPLQMARSDEFGLLADSFNDMTRRLREHQDKLLQASKLATIGRIASGVAHEINNPISVILGYTKLMASSCQDADILADVRTIEEEALQCKKIVEGLLTIARPIDTGGHVPDVGAVLRDVLDRVSLQREDPSIRTVLDVGHEPVALDIDEARLRQIAFNMVQNAFDAMAEGGVLTARCSAAADGADQSQVVIEFSDTGQGISPEDMDKLFEPFFTSKPRGTGLGLAICHGIVSACAGTISVHSELGNGTRFSICLPQRAASKSPAEGQATVNAQQSL